MVGHVLDVRTFPANESEILKEGFFLNPTGVFKKGELSLGEILRSVRENRGFHRVGAMGVFVGVVRGATLEGEEVRKLEVEAYEEKAELALSQIYSDLIKEKGIADVRIYHNIGEFKPGDDLVYVVVSGEHRANVFNVLRQAVERYKHEAPFFKKEYVIDKVTGKEASRWVEEAFLE
jgi:molybdopterin synthase catalytic subunit